MCSYLQRSKIGFGFSIVFSLVYSLIPRVHKSGKYVFTVVFSFRFVLFTFVSFFVQLNQISVKLKLIRAFKSTQRAVTNTRTLILISYQTYCKLTKTSVPS